MGGATGILTKRHRGLVASLKSCTTGNGSIRRWITVHRKNSNQKSKRELSNFQRQNRPCHRSTVLAIVAYKRSWREIIWRISTKKEKEAKRKKHSEGEVCGNCRSCGNRNRWLRNFFLDDSHKLLG